MNRYEMGEDEDIQEGQASARRRAEVGFLEAVQAHRELGLSWERLGELVAEQWRQQDPDSAPASSDAALLGPPELTFAASKDEAGRPLVTLAWGGQRVQVNPFRARGLANALMLSAELAETLCTLVEFFSKASDQALAQKIQSKLLPFLEKRRGENVQAWFQEMLEVLARDGQASVQ